MRRKTDSEKPDVKLCSDGQTIEDPGSKSNTYNADQKKDKDQERKEKGNGSSNKEVRATKAKKHKRRKKPGATNRRRSLTTRF